MTPLAPKRRPSRACARGQSMVEYLVIAAIAVALLAVPIQGKSSAVELMLDSVHTAYTKFLAAISIPQ